MILFTNDEAAPAAAEFSNPCKFNEGLALVFCPLLIPAADCVPGLNDLADPLVEFMVLFVGTGLPMMLLAS